MVPLHLSDTEAQSLLNLLLDANIPARVFGPMTQRLAGLLRPPIHVDAETSGGAVSLASGGPSKGLHPKSFEPEQPAPND